MAHRKNKNRNAEQIAAQAIEKETKSFWSKLAGVILGNGYHPPPQVRPNEPCWCGSGKKYKHCCEEKDKRKKRDFKAGQTTGGSALGGM